MEAAQTPPSIKAPHSLSPRIQRLRDCCMGGQSDARCAFTTGEPWDVVFDETNLLSTPEAYAFLDTYNESCLLSAQKIDLPKGFYRHSIAERRAWFMKEAMVNHMPQEILAGDLLAGGYNVPMLSRCLSKAEAKRRGKLLFGKNGIREAAFLFHGRGCGTCGTAGESLIPDYPRVLREGFEGITAELTQQLETLSEKQRRGPRGQQLNAMLTASQAPVELAARCAALCQRLADAETDDARRAELTRMRQNLLQVPQKPARDFYEALQSLWLTHLSVLTDENQPVAGVSLGRIDQYLLPYWQTSIRNGMEREFGKELLKCFLLHCGCAADAVLRKGNPCVASEYGQSFCLSGMGKDGQDMTNELTDVFLEVIGEMGPLPAPKPIVRLHAHAPDSLLDKLLQMTADHRGAPFLLTFDERSMAGLSEEAARAGCEALINADNAFDYAPTGDAGIAMCGNDRFAAGGRLNLAKAIELACGNGSDLISYRDILCGKPYTGKSDAPKTGDPSGFAAFETFYEAFCIQLSYLTRRMAELYERCAALRAAFCPAPYVSCLVRGCAEQAKDVTQGGAELSFVNMEGTAFATTVDSLLAVKYLVYDKKLCPMETLVEALQANWYGFELLQAAAQNKAPKYGRDDDEADAQALRVMRDWADEVWRHKSVSDNARYRPGMHSRNSRIDAGFLLPATPDGRRHGQRLSNAICPVNGADTNGPTAAANSAGKALGGKTASGEPINLLPSGADHTIAFPPAMLLDTAHRQRMKSFLRGYAQNGGTSLWLSLPSLDTPSDRPTSPEHARKPQDAVSAPKDHGRYPT